MVKVLHTRKVWVDSPSSMLVLSAYKVVDWKTWHIVTDHSLACHMQISGCSRDGCRAESAVCRVRTVIDSLGRRSRGCRGAHAHAEAGEALALLTLHRAGHDLGLKPKAARQLRQREVFAAKVDPIAALRKPAQPQKGIQQLYFISCRPYLRCID